jgi:hypothetical protein
MIGEAAAKSRPSGASRNAARRFSATAWDTWKPAGTWMTGSGWMAGKPSERRMFTK